MANVFKIKYSDTAAAVPSLVAGEIAINRADKLLFYTDSLNVVQSFSLIAGGVTDDATVTQINAASNLIKTQDSITKILITQK